ncbi:MAG: NYN domain-containing protein [Oscillospiraceae bacterium]
MKRIVLGMTAHVDSGKTTLAEAMLYCSGGIRKLGRVDHGDAFLDTDPLERSRGITIFSKQALLRTENCEFTLLDTPGHVDFAAETERALSVPDCAVLVISGTDGVQSHTDTIWRMLKRFGIPVFIFVNKMDISLLERSSLLGELKRKLDGGCTDFSDREMLSELSAECDEACMNSFLENGEVPAGEISAAIMQRHIFPVCFGSALKLKGVNEFLSVLEEFAPEPPRGGKFAARVFKISQDESGARLTHLKIDGGTLKVRSAIDSAAPNEKVNQIRIYSGTKFTAVDEIPAGSVCAVTGLTKTFAGQCLGAASETRAPIMEPVLSYKLILPEGTDIPSALTKLRRLEEEDPQLRITWSEQLKEVHVSLMGEIQLEVLKSIIAKRFGMYVAFDEGSIAYKETIAAPVVGVGHYEPLRHYAEVHLLLEPAERGSGMHFAADCRKDDLDINWQRLILTHLEEKQHIGVLTGSPITDMKITVVAGRAHLKHTEGGDFRQATYRAVRQGLASAQSVLLEPYYDFSLEIPSDCVGRAMTDLQRMGAEFDQPENNGEYAVIRGSCPVSEMRGYQREVIGYSKGKGRLSCVSKGYFPCHNAEEVIERCGYDFEADTDNSPDSVFCSHGAGYLVKWNEAPSRMHTDSGLRFGGESDSEPAREKQRTVNSSKERRASDEELMAIFERTYGKINRDEHSAMRREKQPQAAKIPKLPVPPKGPEYLLVDGYNIIFAWDELSALAKESLDLARNRLIHILCNYQGFKRNNVILVFDAYKVKGSHREVETVGNISVIYTREAETADMYIEKTAHELTKQYRVRVATSDNTEQIIVMGSGAIRVSASEFLSEIRETEKTIRSMIEQ